VETLTEATTEMMMETMGDGDDGSSNRDNHDNDKMVMTMAAMET